MIGSLMSRMADAEKLSVAQLNQAVKNGTIPAYVGVPLIQEKLKAEQAAKAMVAQTQAQPPIARQVMEQADMMSGLEKLRSNLPEEGFAGGGIVAFAEGGEAQPKQAAMSIAPPEGYALEQASGKYITNDQAGGVGAGIAAGLPPELTGRARLVAALLKNAGMPFEVGGQTYAEGGVTLPDEDEDEEKGLMSRLMAGITSLKSGMPESYEAELAKKGQTPASARKLMIDGPKKGDYVMPPLDSQRPSGEGIMQKRGGHKYEDLVIREAERIGLDPNMAIHVLYKETGNLKNPETVRSKAGAIGVMQLMPKTAKQLGVDPLNPEENIRGGVMYLKQMYDKYQDPTLAFAAYNAGPGRVDKALRSGQGIASLPRETQNYIRMADGGIVAFQNTGLVSGEFGGDSGNQEDYVSVDPYFVVDPMTKQPMFSGYRKTVPKSEARSEAIIKNEPPKPDTSPLPVMGPTDAELGRNAPAATPAAAAPEPAPYKEPPPDSGLSDIKNLLKQRMEESGKQKRIDAYLSLLQAGLGMMGGTSPFAAANIGQGAATGVAAQMAARKSQVADENAILSGQLGLSRAELYEKMRRDALKQQYEKDIAAQKLGRERLGVQQQALNVRLGDLRRKAIENWDSSPDKAQLEADLTKQKKNWRQDANLLGQYNMMKERFINGIVNVGQADNILSSSQL